MSPCFVDKNALESYLDIIINTQDEGTEDNQDIIDGLQKVMEEGLGTNTPEAAQPKAPAAVPSEELKGRHLVLAEHELAAALKAKDEGENVFEITVFVQPSCILKAARAFLVFKALEEAGDITCCGTCAPTFDEMFAGAMTTSLISETFMTAVRISSSDFLVNSTMEKSKSNFSSSISCTSGTDFMISPASSSALNTRKALAAFKIQLG